MTDISSWNRNIMSVVTPKCLLQQYLQFPQNTGLASEFKTMASPISFITHPAGIHTPYGVIPVMNMSSTPVFDLYQQVPQLNNYQAFKPSLNGYQAVNYPVQQTQRSSVYVPGPNGPAPFAVDSSISEFNRNGNHHLSSNYVRRDEQDHLKRFDKGKGSNGPNTFSKRDGWNSGWGGSGNVSKSPAISALALLGFLFFLNLIQNSLQNNRQMLTTTVVTNTTTSTSSGSSTGTTVVGRSGRVRRKRGFGFEEHNLTPGSIPTHPNRQIETFLLDKDDQDFHVRLNGRPFPERQLVPLIHPGPKLSRTTESILHSNPNRRIHQQPTLNHNQLLPSNSTATMTSSFFQKIKQASLGCIQLAACNVGRNLHAQIGPRAGLFMRMLRQSFPSSQRNRNNWTSRMAKALTYGWTTKRDCYRLFRNCFWNPQYKHQYSQENPVRRNNSPIH